MSVIDDLLENIGTNEREALNHIRARVHALVPDADEVKTYGMPGFKYKGKYLISFAAFKDHLSIFPGAGAIELLRDELKPYKTAKGTIQFTINTQLPDELIKQIILIRKYDIDTQHA